MQRQREAVCVLVRDGQGSILSISRPWDRNDIGLIGGGVEPVDGDLQADRAGTLQRAAARELWEEAGVTLSPAALAPVFEAQRGQTRVTTFVPTAPVEGVVLGQNEEGWVRWATAEEVCAGRFGAYNRALLAALAQRDATAARNSGQSSTS